MPGTGVAAAPTTVDGSQPFGLQPLCPSPLFAAATHPQDASALQAVELYRHVHGSGGFGQSHGGVMGADPEQAVQLGQSKQLPQLAQLYVRWSVFSPLWQKGGGSVEQAGTALHAGHGPCRDGLSH